MGIERGISVSLTAGSSSSDCEEEGASDVQDTTMEVNSKHQAVKANQIFETGVNQVIRAKLIYSLKVEEIIERKIDDLPDGVMVVQSGRPLLILGDNVLPWTPYGYQESLPRPSDVQFSVLTPRSTVQVIAAGYVPIVHASAQG